MMGFCMILTSIAFVWLLFWCYTVDTLIWALGQDYYHVQLRFN
jgi:hypothetical protein